MTLLAVERIKLLSTRSPYWCVAAIIAATLLMTLPFSLVDHGEHATLGLSLSGLQLGMMVFMVLAALAMTTEYRFSTIRVSFLATPKRERVFLAKTVFVALLSAVLAAVLAPIALLFTKALASNPAVPLQVTTGSDWRVLMGNAALFPIAAIIAISVGALIRQSAGAITILLVWPMLIEGLVSLIPNVGPKISAWMPFTAGSAFVTSARDQQEAMSLGGSAPSGVAQQVEETLSAMPTPLQGLGVFAATAVVLWVAALVVLRRRDA